MIESCAPDAWSPVTRRAGTSAHALAGRDPDRVHSLNNTAAVVFELCAGDNTEADIAELVGRAHGLDEPPRHEVASCLDHLQLEGIVR